VPRYKGTLGRARGEHEWSLGSGLPETGWRGEDAGATGAIEAFGAPPVSGRLRRPCGTLLQTAKRCLKDESTCRGASEPDGYPGVGAHVLRRRAVDQAGCVLAARKIVAISVT